MSQTQIEHIESMIQELLDATDLDVALESEVSEDRLYFNFKGPDQSLLLSNRGDVLKGLTMLMKTYQDKHFPDASEDIKFDADSYLRNRDSRVQDMALQASEGLKQPGDKVTLEPMNSYDRRMVHLTLQDKPALKTHSVGEGALKKIVIEFVGESASAEENDKA